jgi:hypothetical protein
MEFTKKDNLPDLVFTQYLYIKEEVCIALLVSILNKSDDAIFWAYEFYYSGFKHEFFNLIWKIYYDFFATLNPAFEVYLLKKHKEWLNTNGENSDCQDKLVSSIIQTLLFRPFNTDMFLLRNICEKFDIDISYIKEIKTLDDLKDNMIQWVSNTDLRSIAQWILNINNNKIKLVDIYDICLDIFNNLTKSKLMKEFDYALSILSALSLNINPNINQNIILLSKIITLFSNNAKLKKGKNMYISVDPEDIIQYKSIVGNNDILAYQILKKACICGIDDFKHLSLFKLTRNKYNLQETYWYHWEYYASFSPIWLKRIKQFGGYRDYSNRQLLFVKTPDDILLQEFYKLYGLEPDECPLDIQNKSIQPIEKIYDWKWFNNKYKKNGIFEIYEEELEEFDSDGLTY